MPPPCPILDALATFPPPPPALTTAEDFLTANEGDAREYGDKDDSSFYTDEVRVEDLVEDLGLDVTMPPYDDANLGRLKVGKLTARAVHWSTVYWQWQSTE